MFCRFPMMRPFEQSLVRVLPRLITVQELTGRIVRDMATMHQRERYSSSYLGTHCIGAKIVEISHNYHLITSTVTQQITPRKTSKFSVLRATGRGRSQESNSRTKRPKFLTLWQNIFVIRGTFPQRGGSWRFSLDIGITLWVENSTSTNIWKKD